MRVVVQRVEKASVFVDEESVGTISRGLVILVGFEMADTIDDINWVTGKIVRLRIFNDQQGVMNCSIQETDGEILVVSQFTLHAKTKKGNRPSYINAATPDIAIPLYEEFVNRMELELGKKIQTGRFGAMMKVNLVNDGPVTILIDSKNQE